MQLKLESQTACRCHKETKYLGGEYLLDYTKIYSKLSNELRMVKAQAVFFVVIVVGTFLEWATWVPPEPMSYMNGVGWHVMKNIQIYF